MDVLLAKLSLEAKIGQLLMIGVGGTDLNAENAAMLRDLQPGAIILLGRNVRDPSQIAHLTAVLQAGANVPRFVSMDQEGGTVVRLTKGATVFPGAMATGATQSTGLAYLEGKVSGAELKALGVNMNLAPVLDVNSNRKNPVIGVRAFGDDPKRVAAMGKAYGLGLQASGVAAVAKHFPGHGDAVEDSHFGLPSIPHGIERLRAVELVPFKMAAEAGLDAMMTAHLVFTAIDPVPATMSKLLLTGVLRDELGFEGILMSDDLEMKAIDGGIGVGPAAVKSIEAGADMLMVIWRRDRKDVARAALLAAVASGELSAERVDQAVRRILAIKLKRGLFDVPVAGAPKGAAVIAAVGNPHHRRVAREIARRAITVVHDRGGALPAGVAQAPRLVVLSSSNEFLAEMRGVHRRPVEIHLPTRPDAAARARVVAAAAQLVPGTDRFVISVSNEDQAALAAALAARIGTRRPIVGVALGAPYLLDDVDGIAAHVCAYGSRPDSVRASARVVAGLDEAGGLAPVQLTAK